MSTTPATPMTREEKIAALVAKRAQAEGLIEWREKIKRAARESRSNGKTSHKEIVSGFLALAKERPKEVPTPLWPAVATHAMRGGDFEALRLAAQNCDLRAIRLREEDLTLKEVAEKSDRVGLDLISYALTCEGVHWLAQVVDELLALGCDARATNAQGETPLMRSLAKDIACGHSLLPHSDVNAQNKAGETALAKAAQNGQPECVAFLLKAGANPNLVDNDGASPLMKCLEYGAAGWEELLKVSNLSIADKSGKTAVDWALKKTRWTALDAMCLVADEELSQGIHRRVMRAIMPNSTPRIEAQNEAKALRDHLLAARQARAFQNESGVEIEQNSLNAHARGRL